MKNFIKKKIQSILYFIELNFKIKVANKSPIDIYMDQVTQECYEFFKEDSNKSSTFVRDDDIRHYSISKAYNNKNNENNIFLEFGVYKGDSIKLFAKFLSQYGLEIYGFDSFEGLEEDWVASDYNPIGTFLLNKKNFKMPKNVRIIKGKIQDTLDNFLNNNSSQKIIFTHMDMDTYTPTKYALNKIKPFLQKGSIILFDELYGFPNWQHHEYKALKEVFNEKEYKYFAFGQRQISIEIL